MYKDPEPTTQDPAGMTGKYPCPTCVKTTSHSVMAIVNSRDFDCDGQVFFLNHYLTVKCEGCSTISFCHVSKFSDDEEYDIEGRPFLVPHMKHYPGKPEQSEQFSESFVDSVRLDEIIKLQHPSHDTARLKQILIELNGSYQMASYLSCILLIRALIDHIPPILGQRSFAEVTNNYVGSGKSFRESMLYLDNSSRKIADAYLHTQIRAKESLPTKTQVEFRAAIDVLLSEVIRVLRSQSQPSAHPFGSGVTA